MRRFRPTPTASLLCLLAALAAPVAAQKTPAVPPYSETIEVREVEVRVDLTALPTFESIGKKGREDFIVIEDGVAHPLNELGPASEAKWIFVLYFDSTLAGPEARQRAAVALAHQAELLTAGGLAQVMVADPSPQILIATASAEALRHALDELAVAALAERPRPELPPAAASAARIAQLDRMTVAIAALGGGGSRALLLPAGGWPIGPQELSELTHAQPGSIAEQPQFRPLVETARVLAGYGWVTYPIALRAPREPDASKADRRLQVSTGGSGDTRQSVPIVTVGGGGSASGDAKADTQAETMTDFALLPFAEISRATSGTLVGEADLLASSLGQLVHRRQFTYNSPIPAPGRLLALEVRWKGGDGRLLQAPRWLRSATPPEVAAARLRRLLAGDAAPPGTGIRLGHATNGVCFSGDGDKHWVRLSTATEQSGEIRITTGEPVQLERSANGFCTTPPENRPAGTAALRTALLAEDLDNDSWTGVVE